MIESYTETVEKPIPKVTLDALKKETKILDSGGNPILMYNRSHNNFENFELEKRNLPNKSGSNKFGFFFSDRKNDMEHYGPFIKSRYLNIKNPFDIRDLGHRTEYKNFRAKLSTLGISDKDLAGFDLTVQDLYLARNKKLTSGVSDLGMNETRMATFNFFDAGNGFYLRKLLLDKGFDGVLFEDEYEGALTAIAFNPEQIVDPKEIDLNQ